MQKKRQIKASMNIERGQRFNITDLLSSLEGHNFLVQSTKLREEGENISNFFFFLIYIP